MGNVISSNPDDKKNDCKEIAKYITIILEQKQKNVCVKLMKLIISYFTLDEQIARYHWPLLIYLS